MSKPLTVILADGDFPKTAVPLEILSQAHFIVCCDGAAASLTGLGIIPDVKVDSDEQAQLNAAYEEIFKLVK